MATPLQLWRQKMGKIAPKPERGVIYQLEGHLYTRTIGSHADLWHRLTPLEVINLYLHETDGCMEPETWLNTRQLPQPKEEKK